MYLRRLSLSHFTPDAQRLLLATAISAISFFGIQMLLQPLYLLRLGFDVAIQAEVIGPGIQKNKYELPAVTLYVFNVLNVETYQLVDHATMLQALTEMQINVVPQLGTIVLDHSVDALIAFSEGTSVLNPKVQREGVVLRPLVEEHEAELGGRLSFKAINPKFLLKYDE